MSSYVYDPALPYGAWLQNETAVTEQRVELPPRVGVLLGSPELPPDWPVPEPKVPGPLDWGKSEDLFKAEVFNVPFQELKNAAATSGTLWAMEQFHTARDAWRRGLHGEAFEYLTRAIHGDEAHDGHELDFRFHFLLGLIRLGSFQHHDAELLDLALAEEAFVAAGRYALCDHPIDAARAYFAAGWCCYCQGRMDEALQYTHQAIATNPKLAEAQFQAAKIILHCQGEPTEARSFLKQAFSLNPAYGKQALLDGDIMPHAALVFDLIAEERDAIGRRASQSLKALAKLASEMNIDPAISGKAESGAVAVDTPFAGIVSLMNAAKVAFREGSLYGYRRANAAAASAASAIKGLRIRVRNEQQSAEELIQTVQRELTELSALQIGPYRLSDAALFSLNKARRILTEAEDAFRVKTLVGYLDAQTKAKHAQTLLDQTIDSYRTSALAQATAEYETIEQEIERVQRLHGGSDGGSIKAFAMIGAIVALFPGSFLSFFSLPRGEIPWSDLILRISLSVAAFALIGAALGALFAPMFRTDKTHVDGALEERRAAIKQTIAELRALIKTT